MARYVVFGAGAIGGVMGAQLFERGRDVVLIARGAHHDAIARDGLRLERPEGTVTLAVPVLEDIARIEWRDDDVVVLAVKSQDSAAALDSLSAVAPMHTAVLCAQNGVDNERMALRRFARVYGAEISCATTYLSPGVVYAHGSPQAGLVVLGAYPSGIDDTVRTIAAALKDANWAVLVSAEVMAWKYAKLLRNLTNSLSAICGPQVRSGAIGVQARTEAEAALTAAGIAWIGDEEWRRNDARGDLVRFQPVGDVEVAGGSSWQSLLRDAGSIESDYLNGEIVLLGRLHGVPTPVNALLSRLANDLARHHRPPGTISEEEFLALLGDEA